MMSLADLTLFTSKEIQQQFLDRRVVTRCDVWQKGIDTDRFHPRNKNMTMRHRMSNGHVNDFLLLYVGRIAKEKRLQDLYGILEELQKTNEDSGVNYRLCFVGDGPYKDELQNEVFRDNENVVFLGELHGEELASTFASADCFVFPSDSETLGFVVLEALASGLPCVAARGGGVPSLIEHEETSFLCIPGNVTDFARRIQQLMNNPRLGRTMAEKARLETTKFNWHASMAKLRHIQYEQAIAQYELRSGVRVKRFIYRTWTRIRHHKGSSI
jgi:sulfoquinovosyltransferase